MKSKLFLIILTCFCATLSSCKKDDKVEYTPVYVRMTDAPGNFDAVNIDVASVQVHTDDSHGWIMLNTNAGIYNLLDLTNGVDVLIANGDVPSGRVSDIRLILGSNNSVIVNGQSYPLQTPSAMESGLKLKLNTYLDPGIPYNFLLDFDAAQSIVSIDSNKYLLKPVINAISTISGGIKGKISPANAQPSVMAVLGAETFATYADTSGNFLEKGLPAGTYEVVFYPCAPYIVKTITNVIVKTGSITDMGTINF